MRKPKTMHGEVRGLFWRFDAKWEPRDLWIGVYWNNETGMNSMGWGWSWALDLYVCIIPCLPIKLTLRRMKPTTKPDAGVNVSKSR